MEKIKVVHYINQFFGGIGGEDKAGLEPQVRTGKVGPGIALQNILGDEYEIVATIVCGDNYFVENLEKVKPELLKLIKEFNPQIFFAGPAFNAGRYGVACGTICEVVQKELNIPVVTGVFSGSPAAEMFNRFFYIASTADSARGMEEAVRRMVNLGVKLLKKLPIGDPEAENYIPRGVRQNIFCDDLGAKRAVDMLVKKLAKEPFKTEYPMPSFDRVPPAHPVHSIAEAVVGLTGCGGIVPKNNPDRIEASSASKYGTYSIAGISDLTGEKFESAHGGYDTTYANEDPDRVLPVDILRDMEKEGKIKKLHDIFYSTVGNGTSVENAKRYGQEIAQKFKDAAVNAAIVTST